MNTTIRMKAIPFEPVRKPAEGVMFEKIVTVKRIVMTSAMLLVFTLMALGLSTAQGSSTDSWYSNLNSARSASAQANKPLFVMIARTGCHACEDMEKNLSSPTTRRALSGAVKVRLETSQYPQMTSRYAAGGTPTTLIFAPGNTSSPVYSYTGVMDRGTIVQLGHSINSMR